LTLVWASHNLGQVKRLATRVIYLEFGRILADLPALKKMGVKGRGAMESKHGLGNFAAKWKELLATTGLLAG
jgi:ABC-type uncharacterized transport system ATPase subunit